MPTSRRLPRSRRATTTTMVLVLAAGAGAERDAVKGQKERGARFELACSVPKAGAARLALYYSTVTPTSISTSALSPSSLRALPPRTGPLSLVSLFSPPLLPHSYKSSAAGHFRESPPSVTSAEIWISHRATLTCVCGVRAVARRKSGSDSDFEHESGESNGGFLSPCSSSSSPDGHKGSEENDNNGRPIKEPR